MWVTKGNVYVVVWFKNDVNEDLNIQSPLIVSKFTLLFVCCMDIEAYLYIHQLLTLALGPQNSCQ